MIQDLFSNGIVRLYHISTTPLHKLLEILLTFVLKDDILYIVVNEVQQQLHISFLVEHCGELSEWLKEHAWKACVR